MEAISDKQRRPFRNKSKGSVDFRKRIKDFTLLFLRQLLKMSPSISKSAKLRSKMKTSTKSNRHMTRKFKLKIKTLDALAIKDKTTDRS